MLRRRRSPPVLAEVPGSRHGRLRSLDRAQLDAFTGLLGAVGESRAVLVTGREAKSAVAVGLATVAAGSGRRAVLVECDLARPTLAASLGLSAVPGVAEYLRCEADAPQLLQPVVLAGPATGQASAPLVCIAAGDATSQGPTLLASESFRHMAAKLRSAYDFVVAEGPPVADQDALIAASVQFDATVACCSGSELPQALRAHVDGLVVPAGSS